MDSSIQNNTNNVNGGNDELNRSQSRVDNNISGLNTPVWNGAGAGSSAASRDPLNDYGHPSSSPSYSIVPPPSTRPLPTNDQSSYNSQQFHQSYHGYPPQQQQQHQQFLPYYRTAENNIGGTGPPNNDMYNSVQQQGYGGVYGGVYGGGMNLYDGSNIYNQYASPQQQQQHQYNMNVMDGYDGNMICRNMPQSSIMQQAGAAADRNNHLKGDVKGSGFVKGGSGNATAKKEQDQQKLNPDKSLESNCGPHAGSGTSPQQGYGGDGASHDKTQSSDHLEVAKACLNLHQDGMDDQQQQLQQQQQYPRGYTPDINPISSSRYPQQHHQYPFQQSQQPYPAPSSFQQQYQQSGTTFMPQRSGSDVKQNDFGQGYFPNPMNYGSNFGPSGGMAGFHHPFIYQSSSSDEYNRQMMMQLVSGGIGVGGDVSIIKGMKRPFDQMSSSSHSVVNDKRAKKSIRSNKSDFSEKIFKAKKGKRPHDMPKRPLR